MFTRIPYTVEKVYSNDQYVDLELTFPYYADIISFSFFYRKNGQGEWVEATSLRCSQTSTISGNIVSSVLLQSGVCSLRWYYPDDKIEFNDSVQIEIRPEPYLKIFSNYSDKTSMVEFDLYGASNVTILSEKRMSEDTYLSGNSLYYAGDLLYSSFSNPLYVDIYVVAGTKRFLVADSGNSRIVEIDVTGTLISQYTFGGFSPIYCSYNSTTGRVIYVDASTNNVQEIKWKVLPIGSPDPFLGTITWDYNSSFGGYPLTNPTACTYGCDDHIVITDDSIIKIDVAESIRTQYSSFIFKRDVGDVTDNLYYPNSFFTSYEFDSGKFIVVEKFGNSLGYLSSLNHVTYNRALRDDTNLPCPRAFENSLFYPVKPILKSDDVNLTVSPLNGKELSESSKVAFIDSGRVVPPLDGLNETNARGDVIEDYPFWGVSESYNRGSGTQTLACITGQTLNVKIPFSSQRIGFNKSLGEVESVYVKEGVSISLVDLFTGEILSGYTTDDFNEDIDFSFFVPEATQRSYNRSLTYGAHGVYQIKVEIVESYYSDNLYENEVLLQKTFNYFVPVYSFWWRQIFKQIQTSQSPVKNPAFVLEDFTETMSLFFDNYTKYPDFYRVVGTTTLTLTDLQKEKILTDNAFGLLSFYVGISIGNSPISNLFGLTPALCEPVKTGVSILDRIDITERTVESNLPGLNAEYQSSNLFENDTGEASTNSQFVKDTFAVLFSQNQYLLEKWKDGGVSTVPLFGNIVSTDLVLPDGRERLDIDIDLPELIVDSITLKGKFSNNDIVYEGETSITLSFTTSSTGIDSVTFGLSIDGSTYSTYTDPTGVLRSYIIESPSTISENSVVTGFIELQNSNGDKFIYYASKRAETSTKNISVDNLTVTFDKLGKRVLIGYDLNTRYDFLPYTVQLLLVKGLVVDVSSSTQGDVGNIFSGTSKLMILNYNELYEGDEDVERESKLAIIKVTSLVSDETYYQKTFEITFRAPDFSYLITEDIAVFPSKEEDFVPIGIESTDHVYSLDPFYMDRISFAESSAEFAISSSSMSSSSTSMSSSSSSSSSSISQSSSSSPSSSCLSSSSSSYSCSSSSCSCSCSSSSCSCCSSSSSDSVAGYYCIHHQEFSLSGCGGIITVDNYYKAFINSVNLWFFNNCIPNAPGSYYDGITSGPYATLGEFSCP